MPDTRLGLAAVTEDPGSVDGRDDSCRVEEDPHPMIAPGMETASIRGVGQFQSVSAILVELSFFFLL